MDLTALSLDFWAELHHYSSHLDPDGQTLCSNSRRTLNLCWSSTSFVAPLALILCLSNLWQAQVLVLTRWARL